MKHSIKTRCFEVLGTAAALALILCPIALAQDSAPRVTLNTSKAAPRAMEPLTEQAILRDYKFAWTNLGLALRSNSPGPVNALFTGNVSKQLHEAVASQRRIGLTSRYLNQTHKVDAVFYSPEGDVLELHDTAGYDLQIFDGSKTIYNEHVTAHYVVLMTPGADRWEIRQIQAVPQF